jgi:hypothetical protein
MKFERIRDLSNFYISDKNSYFYKFKDDFESVPLRVKAFTLLEEELQSEEEPSVMKTIMWATLFIIFWVACLFIYQLLFG